MWRQYLVVVSDNHGLRNSSYLPVEAVREMKRGGPGTWKHPGYTAFVGTPGAVRLACRLKVAGATWGAGSSSIILRWMKLNL
jgi:hypothetical protein